MLTVYPLVDAQPFPTTYWLSCPFLVKAIDRLESGGAIRALERRLLDDAELRERVDAAHRSAVEERRRLLTDDDASRLVRDGRISGLMTRGIGGIADCAHLKCLHLHAAHALAGANPIGEIVLARLDATVCPPQQVICSAG